MRSKRISWNKKLFFCIYFNISELTIVKKVVCSKRITSLFHEVYYSLLKTQTSFSSKFCNKNHPGRTCEVWKKNKKKIELRTKDTLHLIFQIRKKNKNSTRIKIFYIYSPSIFQMPKNKKIRHGSKFFMSILIYYFRSGKKKYTVNKKS